VRLQGQYADDETGLAYNRFRYSEQDGRFASHDPRRLLGGEHPFAYPNSPLSWTDPFGLVKTGTGSYSGGGGKGGHHIHSQAAMGADPNYSKYSAHGVSTIRR
jgi:RHS repeat-associated protein